MRILSILICFNLLAAITIPCTDFHDEEMCTESHLEKEAESGCSADCRECSTLCVCDCSNIELILKYTLTSANYFSPKPISFLISNYLFQTPAFIWNPPEA